MNDLTTALGSVTIADAKNFPTPPRSNTWTKIPRSESNDIRKIIKCIKRPWTPKKDRETGIIYAAKGEENGYIKLGWSSKTKGDRIKAIEGRCGIPLEQHFSTSAIRGACRVEQILHKLFEDNQKDLFCYKCRTTHQEWFKKDLAHIRHWVLTVYLWFITNDPYDFTTGLLDSKWCKAVSVWNESLRSRRPISIEEFFMLPPTLQMDKILLLTPPKRARSSPYMSKSKSVSRPSFKHSKSAPVPTTPCRDRKALKQPSESPVRSQEDPVFGSITRSTPSKISRRRISSPISTVGSDSDATSVDEKFSDSDSASVSEDSSGSRSICTASSDDDAASSVISSDDDNSNNGETDSE